MNHPKLPLLDWTKITQWRDVIIDATLEQFAPKRDRAWLLANKPDNADWGMFFWYEPLITEACLSEASELLMKFGPRLPDLFEKLRVVHLCRPVTFETYRERGIVRLNPVEVRDELFEFLKSEHPELTRIAFDRAVARAGERLPDRLGKVYFGIDERFLLRECGHYAVCGSEYALDIATELGTHDPDYRQTLERRGRPAYVVIHLPTTVLNAGQLADLAGDLIPAAISSYHLGLGRPFTTGSGWDVSMDIPPEMIHDIVPAPQAKGHWAK